MAKINFKWPLYGSFMVTTSLDRTVGETEKSGKVKKNMWNGIKFRVSDFPVKSEAVFKYFMFFNESTLRSIWSSSRIVCMLFVVPSTCNIH